MMTLEIITVMDNKKGSMIYDLSISWELRGLALHHSTEEQASWAGIWILKLLAAVKAEIYLLQLTLLTSPPFSE